MAKFICCIEGADTTEMELKPGNNRIGRSPANDFRIEHPTVSGAHCEVILSDFSVLIRDLGSTNGTYVDGIPIQEVELQAGQKLTLGAVEIQVELPEVRVAIPTLSQPEAPSGPSYFDDGAPACLNHSDTYAHLECTRCSSFFCDVCARVLKRAGGVAMYFCPSCSGPCKPLPLRQKKKPKTWFGRLEETLKLHLHRAEPPAD